jgi:hypothetical protein
MPASAACTGTLEVLEKPLGAQSHAFWLDRNTVSKPWRFRRFGSLEWDALVEEIKNTSTATFFATKILLQSRY